MPNANTAVIAALLVWAATSVVVTVASLPACSSDMVRGVFTPCDDSHNRMFAVQYFNETCAPTDGVALQPPRSARCDEPCASGQWFSPVSNLCEDCTPGTSSNSGGHIIRDFSSGIPPRFVSHCQPEPCSAWVPGPSGGMITSGNQSGRVATRAGWPIDETVESELVTIVNVINPNGGKFIFDYRVESEHYYDGLKVLLNGTQFYSAAEPHTYDYRTRFLLSGVHLSWRHIEIPLPATASTEVTLIYQKDRDQSSLRDTSMAGLDRAFVRDIIIEGVQMFAPECTPCSAGTHSGTRALSCAPCPANSFSEAGMRACINCSAHQWSPPGSHECIDRLPCREEDFVATYTRCSTDNNTRFRSWSVAHSSRCDPSLAGSVAPKVTENVPCRACSAGWAQSNSTGECVKCPLVGQMRDLKTNACNYCPAGLAAVPAVHFDDGFDEFGSEIDASFFETECSGECGQSCENGAFCTTAHNSGFGLVSLPSITNDADNTSVAIQSQSGNGGTYESTLRYKFTSRSSGFYHLKFFFAHTGRGRVRENDAVSAVLRFDNGSQVTELNNRATLASRGAHYGMYHDIGDHVIEIVVSQSLPTPPADEALFTLVSLEVSGDIRGAAHQCEMCQPGTYCMARSAGMLPCPIGTAYSGYHAHQCIVCQTGYYADVEGLRECKACPSGTASNAIRSQCESTCEVHYDGLHFDLEALSDTYFGPIAAAGTPESSFYMNLCHFVNRNGSSSICEARNGQAVRRSYACQHYSESRSYSLGALPSFGLDATGALTFAANGGDFCQHGGMARSTNVTLVCDPAAPVPGQLEYVEENPHCHYRFSLRTQAACALCTEESFTKTIGECSRDGTQEVTYGKRPGLQCSRGFVPPPPRNLSCDRCLPNYLEPSWSQCDGGVQRVIFTVPEAHMGCTDDGTAEAELRAEYKNQKIALNRTCHEIEVAVGANTFTFGLAIILIIVLALCAVIVIAFLEYDKLHSHYNTLQSANAQVGSGEAEMREVPRDVQDRVERANRTGGAGATAVHVTTMKDSHRDDDADSLPEDGGEPAPAAASPEP